MQQPRRRADPARRLRDIVGVEDQPAITRARLPQHAIELVARERAVVQLDHPKQREIDDAGIDALVNSPAAVEAIVELELARQRDAAEWIAKVGEVETRADFAQNLAIAPAFFVQHPGIERIDADMRKSMTADLMPAII